MHRLLVGVLLCAAVGGGCRSGSGDGPTTRTVPTVPTVTAAPPSVVVTPAPTTSTTPPTTTTSEAPTSSIPPALLADDAVDGVGAQQWEGALVRARSGPVPAPGDAVALGLLVPATPAPTTDTLLSGMTAAADAYAERLGGAVPPPGRGGLGRAPALVRCAAGTEEDCVATFTAAGVVAVAGVDVDADALAAVRAGLPGIPVWTAHPDDAAELLVTDGALGGGCIVDLASLFQWARLETIDRLVVLHRADDRVSRCIAGLVGATAATERWPEAVDLGLDPAGEPATVSASALAAAGGSGAAAFVLVGTPADCAGWLAGLAAGGNRVPVVAGTSCQGPELLAEPASVGALVLHDGYVAGAGAPPFAEWERVQMRALLGEEDALVGSRVEGFRLGAVFVEAALTAEVVDTADLAGRHLPAAEPTVCRRPGGASLCQVVRRLAVWDGTTMAGPVQRLIAPLPLLQAVVEQAAGFTN